ncbi:MAG: zinc-ribbon domain-containing protein, partial [Acidobacteria bacterium]|nr:zinc-ribbon domain-containing protein [Acidobacteriota bacterium]
MIRCDNCSVSLQLDESKIPSGNFTVRCPRCQNMLRANKDAKGASSATAQLAANQAAPATGDNAQEFAEKQTDFEINSALRSLLTALQHGKATIEEDDTSEKPRRVLLCLGDRKDAVAKVVASAGYRVYIAQTP